MSSKETEAFCRYHRRLRADFADSLCPVCAYQQDQIVDKKDQGSGACSCLGYSVLRIFEAQKLLDVAEANFQGPTPREDLQDLRGLESEIGGEEAIVAATAAGVAHHDNA